MIVWLHGKGEKKIEMTKDVLTKIRNNKKFKKSK